MLYWRSQLIRTLLCGLVLATVSTPAGAQEPRVGIDPETQALEERERSTEEVAGLTTETLEVETLEATTLAAGEAALKLVARLEAELLQKDLVDQERYPEAVPVAERIVELTEEEFGVSLELGVALSNLAVLQRRIGLYEPSEQNFLRGVDVMRDAGGPFNDTVIDALVGLGINYRLRGDYFEALTIFEEARTVSRRVNGLMNEQQIDILDQLTNTMFSMKRYAEADQYQRTALHLMERVHGTETVEVLPAIYKYARWLRLSFRYQEERDQYARAMDIIRDHEGPESLSMTKPLGETGNSFRIQKVPDGRAINALKRALAIAESKPEPDKLIIAKLLVDIGDWNVAFSKMGSTGEEYRRAWHLLGELENGDALRKEWFDEPNYVLREYPSSRGISDASDSGAIPGYVLITFDVSDLGKTTNVTVIESVPPGLKDDSTARALNRSRFRPRLVDGEPVWTQGLARTFNFHYQPRD